ncbi:hypothetical protein HaLaN_18453, partial [Haematococcus lacustris]
APGPDDDLPGGHGAAEQEQRPGSPRPAVPHLEPLDQSRAAQHGGVPAVSQVPGAVEGPG